MYIESTQTGTTAAWTGTTNELDAITEGTQIMYHLQQTSAANVTLNLTLSNGTTTGAKDVYFVDTTRLGTQFAKNSMIGLIYDGGTWRVANPYTNSNTYDRTQYKNNVKAKTAISAKSIIVGNSSGYSTAAAGVTFDINYPVLWATAAIEANAVATTTYINYPSCSLRVNKPQITLTANSMAYLVGTLSDTTFTIDSVVFGVAPTQANGKVYIPVGMLYSTYQIYFQGGYPTLYEYGENGFAPITGADGVGVSDITAYYYLSTSNVQPEGGSWSTTQPEWENGMFYWTRSKITYSNGDEEYTTPILASGMNSANSVAAAAENTANSASTTAQAAADTADQVKDQLDTLDSGLDARIETKTNKKISEITGTYVTISDYSTYQGTINGAIARINETLEGIQASIDTIGGNNIFRYKKEFWQSTEVDENGRNLAAPLTEYTDTDLKSVSASGIGYLMNDGESQQVAQVSANKYTISFKYKVLDMSGTYSVTINGEEAVLTDTTWKTFVKTIETTDIVDIIFSSTVDGGLEIADLMGNLGAEAETWTQNPNETITDTVTIGKGIQVENSATNTYTRIDADGNRVFDSNSNEVVSEITDKGTTTTFLTAKTGAQILDLMIQEIDGQIWFSNLAN